MHLIIFIARKSKNVCSGLQVGEPPVQALIDVAGSLDGLARILPSHIHQEFFSHLACRYTEGNTVVTEFVGVDARLLAGTKMSNRSSGMTPSIQQPG